jgi:hypothetical protein
MNKLLWSFHIILTLALALFGLQKVLLPIPDLLAQGMLWIEDFPAYQVRGIGALEFLGVLGLNLPYLVKALPKQLVPLAAGGLALTMMGAIVTHVTRQDHPVSIVITCLLFAMSATLATKRLGEIRERTTKPNNLKSSSPATELS